MNDRDIAIKIYELCRETISKLECEPAQLQGTIQRVMELCYPIIGHEYFDNKLKEDLHRVG